MTMRTSVHEEKEVWEWSWLQVPDGPDSVDYAWFGDPSGAGVDVTAKLKQKLDESTTRGDGYNLRISYKVLGIDPAPKIRKKLFVQLRSCKA